MKLLIATLFTIFSISSFATSQTSEPAKCEHGDFVGFGATKSDARKEATTQCFNHLVQQFERANHRSPSVDEAEEFLIQQCLNICS